MQERDDYALELAMGDEWFMPNRLKPESIVYTEASCFSYPLQAISVVVLHYLWTAVFSFCNLGTSLIFVSC